MQKWNSHFNDKQIFMNIKKSINTGTCGTENKIQMSEIQSWNKGSSNF